MPGISGVGISFGADRIYDVLNQLELYPEEVTIATQLLFINFGETETNFILPIADKARKAGIRTEIYPDSVKMKKQMQYANAKSIPFVAIAGETEIAEGKVMLKNMITGEQKLLAAEQVIAEILK
jgi:histidyl-tRNA synthetase